MVIGEVNMEVVVTVVCWPGMRLEDVVAGGGLAPLLVILLLVVEVEMLVMGEARPKIFCCVRFASRERSSSRNSGSTCAEYSVSACKTTRHEIRPARNHLRSAVGL